PTQNAAAMLALLSEVDHPQVRLNFDTANILYYNAGVDVAEELEKVKDLVQNVHVKDSRGRVEDWYFPAVGDGGAVDFASSVKFLTASVSAGRTRSRSRASAASRSQASRSDKTGSPGASGISGHAATSASEASDHGEYHVPTFLGSHG